MHRKPTIFFNKIENKTGDGCFSCLFFNFVLGWWGSVLAGHFEGKHRELPSDKIVVFAPPVYIVWIEKLTLSEATIDLQ